MSAGVIGQRMTLIQRFKKYAENAFWLMAEKGFALAAGMIVGIYVARYLRPEAFGLLNYSISFVGIFSALSTLGLEQIIVRELSRNPERKEELLGTGVFLKLAGSVVLILVMAVFMLFMNQGSFTNSLIMIIAAAEIFKCFEVVNYFYQSQVRSKYVVRTQLFINLIVSLIKIAMVYLQFPLVAFAAIVMINSVLNGAGYLFTYARRSGRLRDWHFDKKLALSLLNESWPLALYGIALHIQARIDQVMLGNLMNNYEVGQYSVALKFIEIFGFVPMVLMSTFTPAVSKAKMISEDLYHARLINFYRLMFVTFLLMAIPIYFFAEDVITLLYGAEYQAAGFLLSLFALRLFFSNMGVGKSIYIVNESMFTYSLLTVVIGAASNIGLNFILIPAYGTVGAIVASMISFTISIFIVDLFFKKAFKNLKLMIRGMLSFWRLKDIA
ncbi:MAG TPA: flippase [Cyclobacteriaceae bacterium]|nr:flippase [Cyclobacteriaceae bacterium]